MAWLAGWTYRKAITVTNANADYQTKVLVGESSGATGEEVDCGGKCLSTFGDLRFTAADGETLLDYWIESITGTTPNQLATIWVQNNATPDTTLYMYYGKAGATSVANGANTFLAFEDFEWGSDGDSVATSGGSLTWTVIQGTCTIETGDITPYGGTRCLKVVGGATDGYCSFPYTAGTGYAIRFRVYKEAAADMVYTILHGNGTKCIDVYILADGSLMYYDTAQRDTTYNTTNDAWNLIELNDINWAASYNFDIWANDAERKANANMYTTASFANIIELAISADAGEDAYYDDIIVRKWATTEPSFAFGSEESISVITSSPVCFDMAVV